jgi:TRAP-type C4-dicarboxylate transport system permease small subunit
MGGLRGVGTRLTLWLALLGGSLVTSAGKHIHVDLLLRALPVRLRAPASIVSALAAALVCLAGVWGFVDHIAIESFGARAGEAPGAKLARVAHQVADHAYLTRKQLGLDLRTMPRVLVGGRYDGWMTAPEWNAWVKEGFEGRYPAEGVANLLVPDDSPPHVPLVISPEGEPTRGILVHDLSMVFPFGLLMIGVRFLLRVLLILSGHISVDPDEAHKEELRRASEGAPAETAGGA